MATKEEILDSISNMTVLELSELLKDFEERFGVTAAAPVAVAGDREGEGGPGGRRRHGRTEVADIFEDFPGLSPGKSSKTSRKAE
jgi:large subunit ribosomal protein L7/L12